MKRVYTIFETRSDPSDDQYNTYEDRFVDVYDNFPSAAQSIKDWAEQESKLGVITYHRSDRSSEVIIRTTDSPYSNEDRIWLKREIKSTLLKG